MKRISIIFLLISTWIFSADSLQTGFICNRTIHLSCPKNRFLIILDVVHSPKCPSWDEREYAPSSCIAYEPAEVSDNCNGKENCLIDYESSKRPSFWRGEKSSCDFKGGSMNIEYQCVPTFDSSELPRIDICSSTLNSQINEAFIHTPNYPEDFSEKMKCSKIIGPPPSNYQLKIFAIENEIRFERSGSRQSEDFLQINENGNQLNPKEKPFSLLFDDVIEASLTFNSISKTKKKFLLYFLMKPIRRFQVRTSTNSIAEGKTLPLIMKTNAKENKNSSHLTVILIAMFGIVFVLIVSFLLYKRRNDRRVRYLSEMLSKIFKSSSVQKGSIEENHKSLSTNVQQINENRLGNDEHIYTDDPLQYVKISENYSKINRSRDENIYERIPDDLSDDHQDKS